MELPWRYSAQASMSPELRCSHSWSSGSMPQHRTCTACGSPRKRAVSSSDTKTSGRSAISRTPEIVSWSVTVTKSMPRRLARSYTSSGGVAHSGRPRARWTPRRDSCVAEPIVLEHGPLETVVGLDPFMLEIRRSGRRLIRGLSLWAAAGESRDQFIQLTEGVIAAEELERPRRLEEVRKAKRGEAGAAEAGAARASEAREAAASQARSRDSISLSGDLGSLRIELHAERLVLDFTAAAAFFRAGADWHARPGERFTGLGARHREQLDQTGRRIRLGADRRYTGPECPPDMLEVGGIPQGDYAPVHWLLASRGYALWIDTDGDGVELDLAHRISVSTRTAAGPFRLHFLTDPTPAPRQPPRVGLRPLEVPRRLPAPARRGGRLRRLPPPPPPARLDRHRLPLGDP